MQTTKTIRRSPRPKMGLKKSNNSVFLPRTGDSKRRNERGGERRFSRDRDERPARPKRRGGRWSEAAYKAEGVAKTKSTSTRLLVKPLAVAVTGDEVKTERLQKVLARAGIASRRKAELLILEGSVTVNGAPAVELGTKVDPKKDKIKVDGKLISTEVEPIYLAVYKPKGMISAMSDPEGRAHLGEIVSRIRERVIPIGRMDFSSEGLILMTNDGDLADKIFKKRNLPKVFMVKIKGHPSSKDLEFLEKGFFTPEGVIRFSSYGLEGSLQNKSWLRLEVLEGASLDLRELLNRKGLMVDRIVRSAIGDISVKGMEPGEFRFLKKSDFERLLG